MFQGVRKAVNEDIRGNMIAKRAYIPHALTAAAALLALLVGSGCETTGYTSVEESSGAYQDAREFLRVGQTTTGDVTGKYGEPRAVEPWQRGDLWQYWHRETVLLNAYTGTPLGTEGAVIAGQSGFQHTVVRTTRMDLYFDREGVLATYSIRRE